MSAVLFCSLLAAASFTQVLASCAHGTFLQPREEGAAVKVSTFGYKGDIGPWNWVALNSSANALCGTGTRQSPIDMTDGSFNMVPASDIKLDIPDMPEGTDFENLGSTVEVIAEGGEMVVGNRTYELKQFHFHLPSEHLDNGTSMAMEMHMVWQTTNSEIAVIGMYIDIDTTCGSSSNATAAKKIQTRCNNQGVVQAMQKTATTKSAGVASTLLETVFSTVDSIATPGTSVKTKALVMSEVVDLLKEGSFQSYSGSLTTPPCSEGVTWLVSTEKLLIKPETFVRVRDVIGLNSRFPQNTPGKLNVLQLAVQANALIAGKQ